jgi:hypothetical protein
MLDWSIICEQAEPLPEALETQNRLREHHHRDVATCNHDGAAHQTRPFLIVSTLTSEMSAQTKVRPNQQTSHRGHTVRRPSRRLYCTLVQRGRRTLNVER